MNLISFYKSTLGKKFVVALTGIFMILFVIGHMAGNLKTFAGFGAEGIHKLDHYAEFLRVFGSDVLGRSGFLWIFRILLLVSIVLHITTIVQLRNLNKKARPVAYNAKDHSLSKLTIDLMFYGGLILVAFIIFHLLHLTFGTVHDNFSHGAAYSNIYFAFQNPLIVLFYIVAVFFLGLHLYHGAWSVGQTLGINSPKYNNIFKITATTVAVVVTLGFITVPLGVLLGFLAAP